MKKAFTLIELLLIVAIMAAMVSVGVVSLGSSRGSTQVFGATRDVMAMIRRARSMALVTQKPVVLVYSNGKEGDECCAKVEIQAMKLFASGDSSEPVYTLSGELVEEVSNDTKALKKKGKSTTTSGGDTSSGGETLEDVLSPEGLPSEVTKGLKIKVLDENDTLNLPENETMASKISVFSTADNISRTYTSASETESKGSSAAAAADEATEEPFKVAFAVNGTVNPAHRIWIYREGQDPEKGLCIRVDRFGEPTCDKVD